jgi:hypothetical protein
MQLDAKPMKGAKLPRHILSIFVPGNPKTP